MGIIKLIKKIGKLKVTSKSKSNKKTAYKQKNRKKKKTTVTWVAGGVRQICALVPLQGYLPDKAKEVKIQQSFFRKLVDGDLLEHNWMQKFRVC